MSINTVRHIFFDVFFLDPPKPFLTFQTEIAAYRVLTVALGNKIDLYEDYSQNVLLTRTKKKNNNTHLRIVINYSFFDSWCQEQQKNTRVAHVWHLPEDVV